MKRALDLSIVVFLFRGAKSHSPRALRVSMAITKFSR